MPQGHYEQKYIANKLWIARKRAGYPQKVVAALLGNRCLSIISEYEQGRKLPSLRTALKLELIYRTPLAELYPDLYAELAAELPACDAIQRSQCHQLQPHESSPSRPVRDTSASPSLREKSS